MIETTTSPFNSPILPVKMKENTYRSSLGLAEYYRKFISTFDEIALPLTDLTQKDKPMKVGWGPHQE